MTGARASVVAAAALLALLLAGCGEKAAVAPPASTRPMRVMSINQCADQIVLALLPPERIASVTWLSRDPATSAMAKEAAQVAVNGGTAEEVLRTRPDLVVAGRYTTPATRAMLARLGWPMLEVDHTASLADTRRVTREIAAAVGEPARGEALIADMDRQLRRLRVATAVAPVRVAAWDGAGFGALPGSLLAELLNAAGTQDVAAGAPDAGRGADVELLVRTAPDRLVRGLPDMTAEGRSADAAGHPVVRRLWAGRQVTLPQWSYACGTPRSAEGAAILRRQITRLDFGA